MAGSSSEALSVTATDCCPKGMYKLSLGSRCNCLSGKEDIGTNRILALIIRCAQTGQEQEIHLTGAFSRLTCISETPLPYLFPLLFHPLGGHRLTCAKLLSEKRNAKLLKHPAIGGAIDRWRIIFRTLPTF